MRIIGLIIFCLSVTLLRAQDNEIEKKGEWLVTNQFGIATLKAENIFKVNASVFEGMIGRDFFLNKGTSIITGFEFLRVNANYNDGENQLFLKNNRVNLPVSVRLYSTTEKPLVLFGDVGGYCSYLLSSQIEDTLFDIEDKETGLGFNFGLQVQLGLKYILDKYSFSLGFKYKSDFANSYKDSKQEFELTDFYAVQIGLGFNL